MKIAILLDKGVTKIDQAIALAATLYALKVTLQDVMFYFLDMDPPEKIPADVIDLDARQHYWNDLKMGSATEVVARRHELTGLDALLNDLADNNGKGPRERNPRGGFMRQGDYAFTLLGQKLNDLKHASTPLREHRLEVIRHFVEVGNTVLDVAWKKIPTAYEGADANFLEAFPEFSEDFSKKPHHLSGFAFLRYIQAPDAVDALTAEVAWWADKFDAAAKSRKLALKRVEAMQIQAKDIGGGIKVAFVEARADEVARAIWKVFQNLDVLVITRPTGVAIMANHKFVEGHLMKDLSVKLQEKEPDAWHFEARGTKGDGLLLSGSARRAAKAATAIGRDEPALIALMQETWL